MIVMSRHRIGNFHHPSRRWCFTRKVWRWAPRLGMAPNRTSILGCGSDWQTFQGCLCTFFDFLCGKRGSISTFIFGM